MDKGEALTKIRKCLRTFEVDHEMNSSNTGTMTIKDFDEGTGDVIYEGEVVYTEFPSKTSPGDTTVVYSDGESEECSFFRVMGLGVSEGTHKDYDGGTTAIIKKIEPISNLESILQKIKFLDTGSR